MSIFKYQKYRGQLEELSKRFAAVDAFNSSEPGQSVWSEWTNASTMEITQECVVLFIGKTGYGKSSTVNAIAGKTILKSSDIAACTDACQSLDYQIRQNIFLSLCDLPGVGESAKADKEYFKLYEDFLDKAAAIVYVVRADARDFSIDEKVAKQLLADKGINNRVIYALGQCDKMEPLDRKSNSIPSKAQTDNIRAKIDDVKRIFSPVNAIVPYSAATGWNLHALVDQIVHVSTGKRIHTNILRRCSY